MIKRELVIEELELNNQGETVAMKGKVQKVYEIDEFMSHRFTKRTLNVMFWAQNEIDYCGG